jgi:hypothetical protein
LTLPATLSGSVGAVLALGTALVAGGYVLAHVVSVALGGSAAGWRWVTQAGAAGFAGIAWLGLVQLLPVMDAAAVAVGWETAWTWVQRAGVVAGVVVAAVLGLRARAKRAFVRQNAEWAATEPRVRALRKAPKLAKDLARAVLNVMVGTASLSQVAARFGVSESKVKRWRDRSFAAVPAARLFRLLVGAWVGGGVVVDRPGFTRGQIVKGRLVDPAVHEEWLLELGAQYAKKRYRVAVLAMLILMTEGRQPLLVVEQDADGRLRFGPGPELRQLLARAPPTRPRRWV